MPAPWPTSSFHRPLAVQVQVLGVLHPNIRKDVCVGLTHADIKDIANNHARTLVKALCLVLIISDNA
jgi:hypothetical protein